MQESFSNWSGSLSFTPASIVRPESEADLVAVVRRAAEEGQTVRVVGAGHSSMPLVQTEGVLVSLEHFKGLVAHDRQAGRATIRTGMNLGEAGRTFLDVGLAMHNLGDVDMQMVVGAVGTGTHGTGKRLPILSAPLTAVRMVTASGDIVEWSTDKDPEMLQAARVSLGVLGIFTEITLNLLPAFRLHRTEWCTHIDDCLANLDELVDKNRNFDFYWYPRSDEARIRIMNPPGEGIQTLAYARQVEALDGWSAEVIAKKRHLKFDEMEYAIPAHAAVACFQDVRRRIKQKHRKTIGWRLLYRTVAADDAFLSSSYKKDTVSISLHHNAGMPFWDYFKDIEPIFRAYGGAPHWGKKHTLSAKALEPLYPRWGRFLEIRRQLDPDGLFLNEFLRRTLGVEPA
jgi:FAD/FMN-containing dehydrogenase